MLPLLFYAFLMNMLLLCESGAPNPPMEKPYYPFDVPSGEYPCDWPFQMNSSDPSSTWAGKKYRFQRTSATPMEPWQGLGYVAWLGLANKNMGEKGGNIWSVKLGSLPCSYSYKSDTPVLVSQFDRINIMVENDFELVQFADLDAFNTCDLNRLQNIGASPQDYKMPIRVSDAFVEQSEYPCRKDVLNPWVCSTKISSSINDVDINPLNPKGLYTDRFKKMVDIGFTSNHIGKTLYFADRTRCKSSIKFQVAVQAGKIIFIPWTEHVERFENNGWLQNAYDKGLTVESGDEVWFVTATYEHNVYQVFDQSKWSGSCPALGKMTILEPEAKMLDIPSERLLYYPSNSPNARHLWKFKASEKLKNAGDEAYLGCWNVYHECCCTKNNTFSSPPPCATTHCNMGPAGGQRILIRRSVYVQASGTTVRVLPSVIWVVLFGMFASSRLAAGAR